MYVLLQAGVFIFLLMIFASLLFFKILKIGSDFIFVSFFSISCVYLFVFPIMNSLQLDEVSQCRYIILTIQILLLFYLPLTYMYLRNRKIKIPQNNFVVDKTKLNAYCIFNIFLAISFLFIALKNELYLTRESVYNPELKANLPFWEFLIYKSYINYTPLLIFFTYIIKEINKGKIINYCFYIILLNYSVFMIFNSRLGFITLIIQLFGLYIMKKKALRMSPKLLSYLFVGGALSVYGYKVVLNIRSGVSDNGLSITYFNPLYKNSDDSGEPLNTRLDGVYLMSEITPLAQRDGFAKGKAWYVPLFLTVGPVILPAESAVIKETFLTEAEGYLLVNYTDLANSTMDFNSTFLTDSYGNFYIGGFLLCSLVFSALLCFTRKQILNPTRAILLILALYFYSRLLIIESEFIALYTNLFKALPILLVITILNPLRLYKNT